VSAGIVDQDVSQPNRSTLFDRLTDRGFVRDVLPQAERVSDNSLARVCPRTVKVTDNDPRAPGLGNASQ
jgi:hypothetical protein